MKKVLLIGLALLVFMVCFAHEYLLLAASYRLQKGDTLELRLFVADGFNIQQERSFQPAITKSFRLVTTDGATPLEATSGSLPILNHKVTFSGGGLVCMERNYARIALATPKFLAYLAEDHLTEIVNQVDQTKTVQRERYTRYLKCLVQSGAVYADTVYQSTIGQAFEIVLLQNPYTLKKGDVLQAKVLFKGRPLANKTITARRRLGSESATAVTAITNAAGVCRFKITGNGEWVLHATHMIPCPDKTDSDWESFWTSFSFAIG